MATMRPPGETLELPKKTPEPPGKKRFLGRSSRIFPKNPQ